MSTDKIDHNHSLKGILRSTSMMSLGTLASRVLGFVRDIIFARFFGTAAGADAFVVAFRLPNLFRRLFSEGAFNASFVPIFAKLKQQNERQAQGFAGEVLVGMLIICGLVTFAAEIFMEPLVFLLAMGS